MLQFECQISHLKSPSAPWTVSQMSCGEAAAVSVWAQGLLGPDAQHLVDATERRPLSPDGNFFHLPFPLIWNKVYIFYLQKQLLQISAPHTVLCFHLVASIVTSISRNEWISLPVSAPPRVHFKVVPTVQAQGTHNFNSKPNLRLWNSLWNLVLSKCTWWCMFVSVCVCVTTCVMCNSYRKSELLSRSSRLLMLS